MKKKLVSVITSLCVGAGLLFSSPALAGLSESISIDKSEDYYKYYQLSDGTFGISKYLGEEENLVIMNGFEGNKTTRLGKGMFEGNTKTKTIKLPYCLNYVEDGFLDGNSSIEEISINNDMSEVYKTYDGVLYYINDDNRRVRLCPRGKSGKVKIKPGFSIISGESFTDCTKVTSVYIPIDVTLIKDKAFLGCTSLTDVYYEGSEGFWNSIQIENNKNSNSALLEANIHYMSDGEEEIDSTPEPTSSPEATSTPEPTSSPEATSTPEPTSSPEADSTPKPTDSPETASTPEPTTNPASGQGITVNPTPAATQVPIRYPLTTEMPVSSATPVPSSVAVTDNSGLTTKAIGKNLSYSAKTDASGNRIATVKKVLNKNVKSVVIPTTIKVNGKSYKVTRIEAKAFSGCNKLTKVVMGTNIKYIGKRAFWNCKKLSKVVITSSKVGTFGKSAFAKIAPKAKVYMPKKKYKTYKEKMIKSGMGKAVTYKKIIVIS